MKSTLHRRRPARAAAALGLIFGLSLNMTTSLAQGRLALDADLPSAALGRARRVRVYLPASYAAAAGRRYPVLYVHDGQNALSCVGTNVAFGWGSWELDRTADEAVCQGRMREILLVTVDASRERYAEYRGPIRPAAQPPPESNRRRANAPDDNARFEAYERFLIHELKPRIDREFRTRSGPADTGVLGSSLGGICSLALAWRHPEVFGLAGCMSSSFQIEGRYFLNDVLGAWRGGPKPVRVYLDSGVTDYTGGDDGRKLTETAARELRRIGWRDGRDLLHYLDAQPLDDAALERAGLREDKRKEARRSQHNEFYWRQRAGRALEFLFPPGP